MSPDLSRQALQTCRLTLARSYIDQDLIAGQPYLDAWESLDRGEQWGFQTALDRAATQLGKGKQVPTGISELPLPKD